MANGDGLRPSVSLYFAVYLIETHLYLSFSFKIIKTTLLRADSIEMSFGQISDVNVT